MLAGMYAGEGGKIVAWNQALTSDMILRQPVIHEIDQIMVPTVLMIGQKDTTAIGKDRAPPTRRHHMQSRRCKRSNGRADRLAFDDWAQLAGGSSGGRRVERGPDCDRPQWTPGTVARGSRCVRRWAQAALAPTQDVGKTPQIPDNSGGRDRDRTCDPYHVKVVLYR
jgi:hypothetical protein